MSTEDHPFVVRMAPAVTRRCDDETPSHRPRSGSGRAGVGRGCLDTVSSRDSSRPHMSETVRAARLHKHGEPLQIEPVELPEPGEDKGRVELEFAGINPVDP